MSYCKDCHREINYRSKRCRKCYNKFNIDKNHPCHIDGRKTKQHYCIICGAKISYNGWRKNEKCRKCSHPKITNHCIGCGIEISRNEYERCLSCSKKGELNNNYVKDRSLIEYTLEWNGQLKESIRKRDDYKCQNCGMTEEEHLIVWGQVLHVHHIDYNKKNCQEDNLITTCLQCNIRANFNRDYWQEFYQEKIHELQNKS
jgi:hypothetical protein